MATRTGAQAETAVAMQRWEPTAARWECSCTGRCLHGETCRDCRVGRLVHIARAPNGPLNEFLWQEHHRCDSPYCDSGTWFYTAEYRDQPWGHRPNGTDLVPLPGVHYPGFARQLANRLRQEAEINAGTYDYGEEFHPDGYTL
ncbi:hypothetical protein [Crossiella sp. CA198]|uniref:hypothetical protein n=1 Tax=Crossiella sp. CA198 TaxID=3455607 RepID=UPI003F8D508B